MDFSFNLFQKLSRECLERQNFIKKRRNIYKKLHSKQAITIRYFLYPTQMKIIQAPWGALRYAGLKKSKTKDEKKEMNSVCETHVNSD
jgi:hypothetical protein